ncbi:MAG: hypothetical protein KDC87_05610, partial [Planctomycetes bacterium]|nr:hypothetical protein [Planctomycetota bacterium]
AADRLRRLLLRSDLTPRHEARARLLAALIGSGDPKQRYHPWQELNALVGDSARMAVLPAADRWFALGHSASTVEQAAAALQKAVDADRNHRYARHSLAVVLAALGRVREAHQHAFFLVTLYPDSPTAGLIFGWTAVVEGAEDPLGQPEIARLAPDARRIVEVGVHLARETRGLLDGVLAREVLAREERDPGARLTKDLGTVVGPMLKLLALFTSLGRKRSEPLAPLRLPRALLLVFGDLPTMIGAALAGPDALLARLDTSIARLPDGALYLVRAWVRMDALPPALRRGTVEPAAYRALCADLQQACSAPSMLGLQRAVRLRAASFHLELLRRNGQLAAAGVATIDHRTAAYRCLADLAQSRDLDTLAWVQRRMITLDYLDEAQAMVPRIRAVLLASGRGADAALPLAEARAARAKGDRAALQRALERAKKTADALQRIEIDALGK